MLYTKDDFYNWREVESSDIVAAVTSDLPVWRTKKTNSGYNPKNADSAIKRTGI